MALEKLFSNRINAWAWMKNLGEKNIGIFTNQGPPTATIGQNKLGPGAIVIDTLTGIWYTNTGTRLAAVWTAEGVVLGTGGLGGVGNAKMTYDFAVDGGAVGSIIPANSPIIPINAIILGGTVDVTTALVGAGSVSLGTSAGSSNTSLKVATVAATYAVNSQQPIIPIFTAATYLKLTAAGRPNLTITVGTITAGKFDLNLVYVQGN